MIVFITMTTQEDKAQHHHFWHHQEFLLQMVLCWVCNNLLLPAALNFALHLEQQHRNKNGRFLAWFYLMIRIQGRIHDFIEMLPSALLNRQNCRLQNKVTLIKKPNKQVVRVNSSDTCKLNSTGNLLSMWNLVFRQIHGNYSLQQFIWNVFYKICGKLFSTNFVEFIFPQYSWETIFQWNLVFH